MTSGVSPSDDLLLWNRFRQGDEQAFGDLYQRYVRVLYSYGLKIVRDSEAVEDAIQDMFIDLWRTRTELAEAQSVRFYLFRSLRRKIHRSLRPENQFHEPFDDNDDQWQPLLASIESDIITAEIASLQTAQILQWLARLPIRQHEAIILRYYQNFSYADMATIMAISEQGARNLVQKSLQTLRRLALSVGLLVIAGVTWLLKNLF